MKAPEVCPICGADVPRNAKACPECGADERSGWSENAAYDGIDLPEEEFDYAEFLKKEFAGQHQTQRKWTRFWWIIAVILLTAWLFFVFSH